MSKTRLLFVSLFMLLVALAAFTIAGAESVDQELRPPPGHPPICQVETVQRGTFLLRCMDLGADIVDINILTPIQDMLDVRTKIDGDMAELRVAWSRYSARVTFLWYVIDEQGNVTSGRYP